MRIKTNFMNKNDNKEVIIEKTFWEKAKESFGTALMSAGIVLAVLLLLWIPFKVVPAIYGNGSNYVATTLSALFIPGDSTSTPIVDKSATGTNTNSGTAYSNVQTQKSYFGKPDLQITLIGTGIIDPLTKQFASTNYAGFNDEIAIKFEVKNIGTNVSGPWALRINTPSRTTPYYDSPSQTSIKPGDRIVFTTTFNSPINVGVNNSYITVDPLNAVDEIAKSNNQLTIPINISGTTYGYNYNYGYGNNLVASNYISGPTYTWTNITANCYANPQTSYVGNPVTWYVTTSGGNGYFTYSWVGTDMFYGIQNAATKTYSYPGTKVATVTVTSNGQSVTAQCSAYIY